MKTFSFSSKTPPILRSTSRRLADFGLLGLEFITASSLWRKALTLCGSGLDDTTSMSDLLAGVSDPLPA